MNIPFNRVVVCLVMVINILIEVIIQLLSALTFIMSLDRKEVVCSMYM